jgi:transketolase
MRILGFTGFAPTGSSEFLLDHAGLNAAGIRDAALSIVHGRPGTARWHGVDDA